MTLRILAPHFVAGIVLGERAAPIVRFILGWNERRIRDYCARRRWRVEEVP